MSFSLDPGLFSRGCQTVAVFENKLLLMCLQTSKRFMHFIHLYQQISLKAESCSHKAHLFKTAAKPEQTVFITSFKSNCTFFLHLCAFKHESKSKKHSAVNDNLQEPSQFSFHYEQ